MARHIHLWPATLMLMLRPYPPKVVKAAVLALCYYWHEHATGLEDDPALLQGICDCSAADWKVVSPVVFGKLFKRDDAGLWQPICQCYRMPQSRRRKTPALAVALVA